MVRPVLHWEFRVASRSSLLAFGMVHINLAIRTVHRASLPDISSLSHTNLVWDGARLWSHRRKNEWWFTAALVFDRARSSVTMSSHRNSSRFASRPILLPLEMVDPKKHIRRRVTIAFRKTVITTVVSTLISTVIATAISTLLKAASTF